MDSYMEYRTGQLDADGDEGEKHEARNSVQVNMRDVPAD